MYGNHFSFQELVTTSTGLPNLPDSDTHLANLASLWNTLNFIREKFGKPIIVNSAYRTAAVNKQVGGAKRSLHMQGRAADIRPKSQDDLQELWKLISKDKADYSELILYPTFIHLAL